MTGEMTQNELPNAGGDSVCIPDSSERFVASGLDGPLIDRRIENIASVNVVSRAAFPREYARLLRDINKAVDAGTLRLPDDYQQFSRDDQVMHFITDSIKAATLSQGDQEFVTQQTILSEAQKLILEKEAQAVELKKDLDDLKMIVLELRRMVEKSGATEATLAEFDRIADIQTALQAEADNKTWTDKFRAIVAPLMSSKALRLMGVQSPKAGTSISRK